MYRTSKSNWIKGVLFLSAFLVFTLGFSKNSGSISQAEEIIASVESVEKEISNPPAIEKPISEVETPTVIESPPAIKGLSLKIDAIALNIPLGKTSLDKAGHLMVPVNPNAAAWYQAGPKIGEAGTALITGHLDSPAGPGVFYNLRKLTPGDEVRVGRADGSAAIYKVTKSASYNQDNTFPWNLVYSTSGPSSLRIITCDGVYNPKTGLYNRNLVVYASLVSIED
jgi:sortase (surface protein transpeptidase)